MKHPKTARRIALLLYNMGGPQDTGSVEPFLRALFADNDLLGLPGPKAFQEFLAKRIAKRRTPDISKKYEEIGGGSPQLTITRKLSLALETKLKEAELKTAATADVGKDTPATEFVLVMPLMRYTEPSAANCINEACAAGANEIWLLTQYPHCARATTGSSLRDFARALGNHPHPAAKTLTIRNLASYGDDPAFQLLWQERLQTLWQQATAGSRHLIVSAHNLPIGYIAAGDPYRDQIYRSARGTLRRFGLCETRDWTLAWQSAVGPVKWMQPDTRDVIRSLGAKGVKEIIIWPIAFVSDHIETMHEIDIEFGEIAKEAGIEKFTRVPNLNDSTGFVNYLTEKVLNAVQEVQEHGACLSARNLDCSPGGEGCHMQPGGCLCGRYWQAGRKQRERGIDPRKLPQSVPS